MPGTLATVVFFHPDESIFDNVRAFINDVDGLLIIDNSEPSSPLSDALKREHPNAVVITNQQNRGIAVALNQSVRYATENGFDWLLTMDQDSRFAQGALKTMKDYIAAQDSPPAIVSPFHLTPGAPAPAHGATTKKDLRITMTSGNLLSLDACKVCGPFDEKLFIDSVDHEYCLRLRKKGFRIVRLNAAVLHHSLGRIAYHRALGMSFKTTNHSAVRMYYITRNRLYVMTKYMAFDMRFFVRELRELVKSFWMVALFEEMRSAKMKAMFRGMFHFVIGRYGPA